jgi:hypothetical protein
VSDSYYGRPILKEPVWKPAIPLYFFTGGLTGASSILALVARAAGNRRLARTSLGIAVAGEMVNPVLLIVDLGRPERFLNMFRVLKVTSPMSVGSWILGVSGGATMTEAACEVLDIFPRLRIVSSVASAVAGAPLATYTGALIADTAVPVWHEARRELPFLFGASAGASAGAAAAMFVSPDDAGPARRLAVTGAIAQNVAAVVMEKRLGFVGEPYRRGLPARLGRLAKAATIGGALVLAGPGRRSRGAAFVGGATVLGGEIAMRFSVFKAGIESARDPKYTVRPQRERVAQRTRSNPE